jgi:hypothetical protein
MPGLQRPIKINQPITFPWIGLYNFIFGKNRFIFHIYYFADNIKYRSHN